MLKTPNPQQKLALETGGSLIVSAAAGAGKTAVMVSRAANMIIAGQDVRRILMVTFTNKAAAEMKQRIKADLASAAQTQGPERYRLRRQMSLVESADICTINSFCMRLLRQYFNIAGVDPMFRICGDTELAIYKLQAMDELMDGLYNGEDADAFRLHLRALAGGSEARLRQFITATYEYAMASPEPRQWLERAVNAYRGEGGTPIPEADEGMRRQWETTEYAAALCAMVNGYHDNFMAAKRRQNVVDFSDAEHFTYAILKNEEARAEIAGRYDHVFVDEYQDTNDIQEAIITRVAGDSLFCVGDVKQSIYAFRHAEPDIFLHRYHNAAQGQRIDLNRNYRSNPGLLAGINRVFRHNMTERVGGVDYDEGQMLYAGRQDEARPVELELLPRDGYSGEQGAQAQAIICARKIEQLLEQQFEYKDGDEIKRRNFTYGDMAVLTFSLKGKGGEFMETLAACGIPLLGSPRREFYSQSEVSAVLCILRLLDNGHDDLSLIGALRSPAGRLTAADLAAIRLLDGSRPLYELAVEHAQEHGELPGKLRDFYAKMRRWRRLNMTSQIHELVADIIDYTGMAAEYALMPAGAAQAARLDALVRRAEEYSGYSAGGLSGFLQLVDLQQQSPDGSQQAAATGDAVNMMTIHGSKGLEYPVVFCVLCEREFMRGGGQDFPLHKHMGIGLQYYSKALDARGETPHLSEMKLARAADARSEQLRLMYVALTRAKERLILTAALPEKAYIKALSRQPEEAASWLDWILPAIVDTDSLPDSPALQDIADGCCAEWTLTVHPMPDLEAVETDVQDWQGFEQKHTASPAERLDNAWIADTLGWQYPHAAAGLRSKIAASDIGKQRELPELKRPDFVAGKRGYTAAELGSLIHRAMMLIDLRFAESAEGVKRQLDALAAKGVLDGRQAGLIDPSLLAAFANSRLGKRAIAAGNGLLREQPFNLLVRAGEVLPGGGDEQLLVQGVVDMAFQEGGEWVIVDYKTNRLGRGGADAIAGLYSSQMRIYAQALQRISGLPVKDVYIFLLREGVALDMRQVLE